MPTISVTLREGDIEFLRAYGSGEVSPGIRRLVDETRAVKADDI